MRRRRATPKPPLLNDRTASLTTEAIAPGKDRGAPPPPPAMTDAARFFVFQNMLAGASLTHMLEVDARSTPSHGAEMIERAYKRFVAQLRDLSKAPEGDVEALRAMQVERIRRDVYALRMRLARQNISDVDYARIDARITAKESLLADLAGTRMPVNMNLTVDVDVRVRSAAMRIVSDVTADELMEMGRELAGLN